MELTSDLSGSQGSSDIIWTFFFFFFPLHLLSLVQRLLHSQGRLSQEVAPDSLGVSLTRLTTQKTENPGLWGKKKE